MSTYNISTSGLWTHAVSNKNKLTCNLVFNHATNNYAFLKFVSSDATFITKLTLALSGFPAALNSLTPNQMKTVTLGSNCDLMMYDNKVYSISSSGLSLISGNLSIQAVSSDMTYVVASNAVYRYAANSYTRILGLISHTNYWITSFGSAFVVWGATSQPSASNYNVNQTIYVVNDVIGAADPPFSYSIVSYNNKLTYVPVHTSPSLTKLHFQFISNPSNTTSEVFIHDLNFIDNIVTLMTFQNVKSYTDTVKYMPSFSSTNIFIGDYYFVVRN